MKLYGNANGHSGCKYPLVLRHEWYKLRMDDDQVLSRFTVLSKYYDVTMSNILYQGLEP